MADWQTYTNSQYGFNIKYPSNWVAKEIPNQEYGGVVNFFQSETKTYPEQGGSQPIGKNLVTLSLLKNPDDLTLQQIFNNNYNKCLQEPNNDLGCPRPQNTESWQTITVDGAKAWRTGDIGIPEGPGANTLYIKQDGYYIEMTLMFFEPARKNIDTAILDRMISTFRFIPDLSDWKTYTNDKSDYTFTYPKSWVADDCGSNDQMIHITPTAIPCGADWYGNGFVVTKLKNKAERDQMIAQEKKSLSNFQKTSITIAGKPAIRITGTNLKTPVNGEMNLPNDSPSDQVFVTNNGTEYFIMNQTFAVSSPYAKEFETFLSTFRFTDDVSDSQMYTDTSPLCTAKPVSTEIGSEIYPSDTKYQKLTFLGPIFTAYKCSSSRLNAVLGNSNGQYTLGSTVWLKTAPSQQLITTLKAVGYLCSEKVSDASCKKWRLVKFVNVTDIMKLEPFSEQLEADDCVFCG